MRNLHQQNFRQRNGVTIPLAIVSALFIAVLSVGLFFVTMIIGGHREIANATDAGNLQVGRDSVTVVGVNLLPSERRLTGLGDPRSNDRVDLLAFNRLVGMALLVQMNAAADGTAAAQNNANALVSSIEGPGGVGERLRNELAKGAGFTKSFSQAFAENSTRMAGTNAGSFIPQEHKIAYTGQGNGDNFPSNLNVDRLSDPAQTPVINFSTDQPLPLPSNAVATSDGKRYLSGYKQVGMIPGALPLVGVPVLPEQSHRISRIDFTTSTAFLPANTIVPPNSFASTSSTIDRNGRDNRASSSAIAGVGLPLLLEGTRRSFPATATTFNPEIPRGYITIYNNGQSLDSSGVLSANPNATGTLQFPGFIFNSTNNAAAQELGVGVDLDPDTGFFAVSTTNQLGAWKNHAVKHPGFPRSRSIIDPPHYASLPSPVGINDPYWENVLRTDSHRDLCWRAYRGPVAPMGQRAGVAVDRVDPLFLEEKFGSIPAYTSLYDPRHFNNPLMGLWKNPNARVHGPYAQDCQNGTIAPGAVQDSVTAHWVPYCNIGTPIERVLDANLSQCSPLAQEMYRRLQFDNAFRGCSGWSYGTFGTATNVTATEAAKLAVIDAYGRGPGPNKPTCAPLNRSFTSGLRKYTADPANKIPVPYAIGAFRNTWSDPSRQGVVTRAGTLFELFEQTQPGAGGRLQRFLQSRMKQIKAEASDGDVQAILNTTIEMNGSPYYVYLNTTGNFTLTQQQPPAAADVPVPTQIDGRVFNFQREYKLLDTMSNPRNENDIHERLFMTVITDSAGTGQPSADGRDIAQFATSSGYNLELGKVVLRQEASEDLQLCDRN